MGHANHRFTNIIHVSAVAVACCLLLVFATSATTARVIRRSADDGSDQPHSNAITSTPVTIVIERAAAAAADQANHNINIATTTVRRRDEENAVGKTADTGTDGGRERQSSPAFVGDIAATTTGPVTSALSAGDKSALKAIREQPVIDATTTQTTTIMTSDEHPRNTNNIHDDTSSSAASNASAVSVDATTTTTTTTQQPSSISTDPSTQRRRTTKRLQDDDDLVNQAQSSSQTVAKPSAAGPSAVENEIFNATAADAALIDDAKASSPVLRGNDNDEATENSPHVLETQGEKIKTPPQPLPMATGARTSNVTATTTTSTSTQNPGAQLDTSINEVKHSAIVAKAVNNTTMLPPQQTARQSKLHDISTSTERMANILNPMSINKGLMDWVAVMEHDALSNSILTKDPSATTTAKVSPPANNGGGTTAERPNPSTAAAVKVQSISDAPTVKNATENAIIIDPSIPNRNGGASASATAPASNINIHRPTATTTEPAGALSVTPRGELPTAITIAAPTTSERPPVKHWPMNGTALTTTVTEMNNLESDAAPGGATETGTMSTGNSGVAAGSDISDEPTMITSTAASATSTELMTEIQPFDEATTTMTTTPTDGDESLYEAATIVTERIVDTTSISPPVTTMLIGSETSFPTTTMASSDDGNPENTTAAAAAVAGAAAGAAAAADEQKQRQHNVTTMVPIIVDSSSADATTTIVAVFDDAEPTTIIAVTSGNHAHGDFGQIIGTTVNTTPLTTTTPTPAMTTPTTAEATTSSAEIDDSVEDMKITTFETHHHAMVLDYTERTLTTSVPSTSSTTATTTPPQSAAAPDEDISSIDDAAAAPADDRNRNYYAPAAADTKRDENIAPPPPKTTMPAMEFDGDGGLLKATATDKEEPTDVNAIIAISVSVVGVICLVLLVGFLYVMRKRQKLLSYSQRCRPIGLDAYSLDNISTFSSVRRKGALQQSKRAYSNAAFDDHALHKRPLSASALIAFAGTHRQEIYDEFKALPTVTAHLEDVPAGCEDKNRFANIVPLPESRCFLQQLGADPRTEYVNANFVKGPHDKAATAYYIATQAPLENTVADFWRLVWEQNSRCILMATDLIEDGVERCAEYLPSSVVLDNQLQFGDFHVELKSREVKERYAVSTVHLRYTGSGGGAATEPATEGAWREIVHVWYQWPLATTSNGTTAAAGASNTTGGAPSGEESHIVAMLLEVRMLLKRAPIGTDVGLNGGTAEAMNNNGVIGAKEMKAKTTTETAEATTTDSAANDAKQTKHEVQEMTVKTRSLTRFQGPLTVHCSSGTGRTGTLIACDIAMRALEQPARTVDIPNIVYFVRNGRAGAVATREQYEFIYKLANTYAAKLIDPSADK